MSKNTTARLTGFVYVLVVLSGFFNLVYVPSQIIVWNDAAATINNLIMNEGLYRLGVAVGILCFVFYLTVAFLLFDLLNSVNKRVAVAMVVLAAISVPISIYNFTVKMDVLALISGADYLKNLSETQIQTQVMLLLKSYSNGVGIVQIFWGLWLLPFGYLAYKSGFIPKFLGVSLMLGCFGWVAFFVGFVIFPDVDLPSYIRKPASIGEIGTALWLLVMGTKQLKWRSLTGKKNNSA